ncbi:MAG: hypothetical protein QOH11_210 [Solirubrobacteraceae bacterium]|nr:hypothetical protein [Solirubrobacteraceae bacterium]
MRRFVVVALAPVLAVVAAGCGSSSSSSTKSSTAAAAPTTAANAATPAPGTVSIGVRETEYKLTPANINPSKSGKHTIVAFNQGKITHAIEVEGGGAGGKDVRSAGIAPGKSATITVDLQAGKTYTWYCPIDGHRGLGMKGTIKVGGSTASASAAPKTTSSSSSGNTSSGSSGGSSGGSGYGY